MTPQASTSSDPIKALTHSKSSMIDDALAQELLDAAIQIKQRAYCPYSKFRVGAAVLAIPSDKSIGTPKIFTGVNVENASYPVGTCAERCAIGTAVAAGYPHLIAIAVSTDIDPPASPCVVMMGKVAGDTNGSKGSVVRRFDELLPMSFGPEDLPDV